MITTPPLLAPAISVVIPMYNTEKYIGACLESILNQTFQDFEVIVVDDCSTDNSVAVVESYVPRFGGRLKISRMEKNSGTAVPSNKGVFLSRGKYVFVMDSDDLIVYTALETLHNLAENFQADVVSMDLGLKFFSDTSKPFPLPENLQISGWHAPPFVNNPALESDNIGERVKKICFNGVGWTACEKLVRRDLLMENDITFPVMRTSQDIIWVMEVFCCARRILTISNPLYIHRDNPTSNTSIKRTAEQYINFYMNANSFGLKVLGEFLDRQRFFQENPQYKWDLFDFYERIHFNTILENISKLPPHEFCRILELQFKEKFGEYGNLIAYLCTSSNFSRLRLLMANQRIVELENQLKQIQGS